MKPFKLGKLFDSQKEKDEFFKRNVDGLVKRGFSRKDAERYTKTFIEIDDREADKDHYADITDKINEKPLNSRELSQLIKDVKANRPIDSEFPDRMLSEILFWRSLYGDPEWSKKKGYSQY